LFIVVEDVIYRLLKTFPSTCQMCNIMVFIIVLDFHTETAHRQQIKTQNQLIEKLKNLQKLEFAV